MTIYNCLYFLGVVLLVIVMIVNWIMDWEVQNLLWIPVGTWLVAMLFGVIQLCRGNNSNGKSKYTEVFCKSKKSV